MTHATAETNPKLTVVTTTLEMLARPDRPAKPLPMVGKVALLHAERPTVSFYRYLYDTVGEPWIWWDRRKLSDAALAAIVQDPKVEVYVLYLDGVPAGYAELDRRIEGEIELAYFGLIPDFIGKGLGPYLLDWAIEAAWRYEPRRVWVHTCTLDHPKALSTYQRAGFVPCRQITEIVEDPRPRVFAPVVPALGVRLPGIPVNDAGSG
jgi:GNAT superfamily N-acetyltransferase